MVTACVGDIIDKNFPNAIYASDNLRFQYWNAKTDIYEFNEPTEKRDMSFSQFLDAMETGIDPLHPAAPDTGESVRSSPVSTTNTSTTSPTKSAAKTESPVPTNSESDAAAASTTPADVKRKYFYMQQSLVAEMGVRMMDEFQK
jgi:hypothetical protein